jgi:hypothetical protein
LPIPLAAPVMMATLSLRRICLSLFLLAAKWPIVDLGFRGARLDPHLFYGFDVKRPATLEGRYGPPKE